MEFKMKAYMVIAKVNGIDYLTKVNAESESGAEHVILDLGYCGRHAYGVEACQAFDVDMMKTECFRYAAIAAEPVSFLALKEIIDLRNDFIKQKDETEDKIRETKRQIEVLQKQLEQLEKGFDYEML